MNRSHLETLSFKELKEIGKEYNVTSNSSEGLIQKIIDADYEHNTQDVHRPENYYIHEEEELNIQLGDE